MKSNLNNIAIFTLALLFTITNTLYVNIDEDPFCLQMPVVRDSQYKLFYQSMSQQSSTISVTISTKNQPQITLTGPKNNTTFPSTTPTTLCFHSPTHTHTPSLAPIPLSLDIYPSTPNTTPISSLALRTHLLQIHSQYQNISNQLKQITHHEQFEQERQVIQAGVIGEYGEVVYGVWLVKVGVVLGVVGGQLGWVWWRIGRKVATWGR